jgi:2-amino-4-hydroxy-6-hydroxymethyldihydropteridine diphosphokinase
MAEAALGLGSNIGDKAANISAALEGLGATADIRILRQSSLYRTAPWGDTDQDWFVNACVLISTSLTPAGLFSRCLDLEREGGRTRTKDRRWGPRIIDIDLLFYEDLRLNEAALTLPHPRLLERGFVLVPLAEIAPDRIINGVRVADAAQALETNDVSLWTET